MTETNFVTDGRTHVHVDQIISYIDYGSSVMVSTQIGRTFRLSIALDEFERQLNRIKPAPEALEGVRR